MSENSLASPTAEPSLPSGFALPERESPQASEASDEPMGETAPVAQAAVADGPLPTIALVAAGLTVFDAVLTVAIAALWSFQRETALAILPSIAGPMLLFGIAPVIVGGLIYNQARKTGTEIVGAHWGRWAIIAGSLLSTTTLMIPLMAALAALSGGM